MGSFVVQFQSKVRNFTVWASSSDNGKTSSSVHYIIQLHICLVSMESLGGFHFQGHHSILQSPRGL